MSDIDPDAYKKDELARLAEAEGVDTSGTKADIAERLEEAASAKEHEGAFDYGDLSDDDRAVRAASQGGVVPDESQEPGGMSFDYGEVPAERP